MDQQNPTLAKIPILDTGKFEQWPFKIQQYLQHEHYALWEVIEFEDSYEVPASAASTATKDITSDETVMDVEIEQDDLNQKFRTSLAPEWLMHTIKKSKINSQNMAFISSAKHSRGNEDVNTASVSTASTNVPTASANIEGASMSQDTACAYIASQSSGSQIKFEDINQIDEDD
nr:hypothetical protein [Tanacetum cinerariifolium]